MHWFGSLQLEDGNRHMKLIEAMKKEFKLMRILWRQIYDHVSRTDFIIFLTTIIFGGRVLNFSGKCIKSRENTVCVSELFQKQDLKQYECKRPAVG